MKTTDLYKEKKATISDLMLFAFSAKQSNSTEITQFIKIVFKHAKEIFPHENRFNSRHSDEINLVKAITHITYTKYRNTVSLQSMGREIAKVIGRKKPFDHTTILAKVKEHIKAATFGYGYELYMARYTKLVGKLRSENLL